MVRAWSFANVGSESSFVQDFMINIMFFPLSILGHCFDGVS